MNKITLIIFVSTAFLFADSETPKNNFNINREIELFEQLLTEKMKKCPSKEGSCHKKVLNLLNKVRVLPDSDLEHIEMLKELINFLEMMFHSLSGKTQTALLKLGVDFVADSCKFESIQALLEQETQEALVELIIQLSLLEQIEPKAKNLRKISDAELKRRIDGNK